MHISPRSLIAGLITLTLALPTVGCPGDPPAGDKTGAQSSDGEKTPAPANAEEGPKTPQDVPKKIKAKEVRGKATVVMPTPDQFLSVLAILGKPKWEELVSPIEKTKFESKSQTALVSGIVLAHFFVHVHAKDAKKAEKSLDQMIEMTQALGIKTPEKEVKQVRKRLKKKKWAQLRQDFLDMNTELQKDLIKTQKKPDLAMLISLGGYLEGANLGAKLIRDDYSKKRAELMRQGDLIKEVERATEATLNKDDKHVALILDALKKMRKAMKADGDTPITKEQVEKIQTLTSETRKKLIEG